MELSFLGIIQALLGLIIEALLAPAYGLLDSIASGILDFIFPSEEPLV